MQVWMKRGLAALTETGNLVSLTILFMASALASYTLDTTDEEINATVVNSGTFGGAVCFLLSDMARAITGEILHVDGGFHAMGTALDPGAAFQESPASPNGGVAAVEGAWSAGSSSR